LQNSGSAFARDFSKPNGDYADLLRLLQNTTKPRVGGVCMAGGGMGLLYMTDMAVAADHAIFGLPEKVGVFPMQVLSLLQAIAPPRLINEWALTGEPFDAKAALAAGLLNYVAPAAELRCQGPWLVGRIVDKSPIAIRRGKYAKRAIASMSFDESIACTESQIALLAMTEDAKEGLKRLPKNASRTGPGNRTSGKPSIKTMLVARPALSLRQIAVPTRGLPLFALRGASWSLRSAVFACAWHKSAAGVSIDNVPRFAARHP
jgi:enoyl-CoA hydratase/carnithine racemase